MRQRWNAGLRAIFWQGYIKFEHSRVKNIGFAILIKWFALGKGAGKICDNTMLVCWQRKI
ncbi:hypothetical protein J42TS3_19450 [Paenibacillus vini]|uniref:Uncharacterized protein n=1 Tax=Paenibacillus vini TaxID=1476024 RepID=A0ABQ4MA84_9BACL|nr:hypothetical protein J42TS3_19450 [Paenibacillus vini]